MPHPVPESTYQLLPPLKDLEYLELKRDIARRGVQVPVEMDDAGNVLDGHHRLRALRELSAEGLGLPEAPVIVRVGMSEAEKRLHVRSLNVHRRHLSTAQRRALIEEQLRETPDRSDRAVAHALSVSPSTVGMVRRRLDAATVRVGQSAEESRIGRYGRWRRVPPGWAILASSQSEAEKVVSALGMVPAGALREGFLTTADTAVAARIVRREGAREERFERLRNPGSVHFWLTNNCCPTRDNNDRKALCQVQRLVM